MYKDHQTAEQINRTADQICKILTFRMYRPRQKHSLLSRLKGSQVTNITVRVSQTKRISVDLPYQKCPNVKTDRLRGRRFMHLSLFL